MQNKELIIFSQTSSKRYAVINSSNCNFFIDSIYMSSKFYNVNNEIIKRNCEKYNHICQAEDWIMDLSYLFFKNKRTKFFLILEDDVKLCPYLFEFAYNVTKLDETLPINLVFLGSGSTGFLIKRNFIPILISSINGRNQIKFGPLSHNFTVNPSIYPAYIKNYLTFINKTTGFSLDLFINLKQKNGLINGIFASSKSIIFHPRTTSSISIMNHKYSRNSECYVNPQWYKKKKQNYIIKFSTMDIMHSSKYIYFEKHKDEEF